MESEWIRLKDVGLYGLTFGDAATLREAADGIDISETGVGMAIVRTSVGFCLVHKDNETGAGVLNRFVGEEDLRDFVGHIVKNFNPTNFRVPELQHGLN